MIVLHNDQIIIKNVDIMQDGPQEEWGDYNNMLTTSSHLLPGYWVVHWILVNIQSR